MIGHQFCIEILQMSAQYASIILKNNYFIIINFHNQQIENFSYIVFVSHTKFSFPTAGNGRQENGPIQRRKGKDVANKFSFVICIVLIAQKAFSPPSEKKPFAVSSLCVNKNSSLARSGAVPLHCCCRPLKSLSINLLYIED